MKSMFDYFDLDNEIKWHEKIYYRTIKRFPDIYYSIRDFFQRIFKKSHTSRTDIWNLYSHLAKIILPKLIEFKKSKRMGYPAAFSSFEDLENSGITKEEYEEHYLGGGEKAWEDIINKIIFSFEYVVCSESSKEEQFYKKYNLKDPHAETEENKRIGHAFKTKNGGLCFSDNKDIEGEYLGEYVSYYDPKSENEIQEKVQKGFELFGEYFRNLWD